MLARLLTATHYHARTIAAARVAATTADYATLTARIRLAHLADARAARVQWWATLALALAGLVAVTAGIVGVGYVRGMIP